MSIFKARHIYTAALDALGKARRPIEALNVFHAMLVMHVIHTSCSFVGKYVFLDIEVRIEFALLS